MKQETTERVRYAKGYRLVYKPEYVSSMKKSDNWGGWIYEHIFVAEQTLGRQLTKSEVVHHMDLDRANNKTENLLVLDRGQHLKLHMWLDAGAPTSKDIGEHRVNSGKPKEIRYCKVCKDTLQYKEKTYCSRKCSEEGTRKHERPSKEQLEQDIKDMSFLAIGRKYGVSDNAIRKWAKRYEIQWQS